MWLAYLCIGPMDYEFWLFPWWWHFKSKQFWLPIIILKPCIFSNAFGTVQKTQKINFFSATVILHKVIPSDISMFFFKIKNQSDRIMANNIDKTGESKQIHRYWYACVPFERKSCGHSRMLIPETMETIWNQHQGILFLYAFYWSRWF